MAGDDQRISKTLAYWLRHRPDAAGLELDRSGWADSAAVLAALRSTGLAVDPARLAALVAASDKQRFELSPDGRRIRARQGHSLAVEAGWTAAAPPALLYHGTVERSVGPILRDGLRPQARQHVHLSPDVETARQVGSRRGPPVVIEVAAAALAAAGATFYRSSNGVWLVDHVPPAHLRRLGG